MLAKLALVLGFASANLQINIDEQKILKTDKAYFEYLMTLPQNSDVIAFEQGLANATSYALAQVFAAQRSFLDGDAGAYKTYVDYYTPTSGCNSTELAACLAKTSWSYTCITENSGPDCRFPNSHNVTASNEADTYMHGNITSMVDGLKTVIGDLGSIADDTVTTYQTNMENILTNYTEEVKKLYKPWGCNMTCVDEYGLDDEEIAEHCDCDPWVKISENSTAFNETVGDVEFLADATTTSSTDSTTTDASTTKTTDDTTASDTTTATASDNTWIYIVIGVVVLVGAVVAFIQFKKSKGTGEEHEEGGEKDNMYQRI